MVAAITLSWEVAAGVLGAVALAWSFTRAGSERAWRSTAEGRGAEIETLNGRLSRSEEQVTVLTKQVADLERRPDMTEVVSLIRGELVPLLHDVKGGLDDLAQRWG